MIWRHWIAAGIVVTVSAAAGLWWSQPGTLPGSETQGSSLLLLDRHGSLLRDQPTDSRRQIDLALEHIPPLLQQAFIQAEDRRFYQHAGVDGQAIARAAWQNLRHERIVSGASTLSMQSARLAFALEPGWWGKLRQALIALRLERNHSKGEVLEYYLNHVPFAGILYGVGQACQVYFATDCQRLSVAQMATLAVLVRAPSALQQQDAALLERRNQLLLQLRAGGALDEAGLQLALAEPLTLDRYQPVFDAPHFTAHVQSRHGGLQGKVATTLDATLQRDVQALVKYHVERLQARHVNAAAVLVVNNADGAVLAYVGSPDYADDRNQGKYDYVQALRQPGSAVKPFTYALALQSGYSLASLLPDLPRVFSTGAGTYRPRNYSGRFTGPRRLREALGNSLNIPAMHTAMELGPEQLLKFYRELGLTSLQHSGDHYGPGLTLGNGEVSLWEMTGAYLALARQGEALALRVLQDTPLQPRRVLDKQLAYLLNEVLRDPLAREDEFGRYNPLTFEYPVAAKTGTSSDYRDNWVLGFSGALTVGVWIGHDRAEALQHVSGITGAGPLFNDVMRRAMQGRSSTWPRQPEGLMQATICPLSGKLPGKHCPTTVSETFLHGHAPHEDCDFHRAVTVAHCQHDSDNTPRSLAYTVLPAEFSEWQRSSNLLDLQQVLAQQCDNPAMIVDAGAHESQAFRRMDIIEPAAGAVYAMDPTIPRAHQQLAIRIMRPATLTAIEWRLNDKTINLQQLKSDIWLWPMQAGRYSLQAHAMLQDGSQVETARVAFVVK